MHLTAGVHAFNAIWNDFKRNLHVDGQSFYRTYTTNRKRPEEIAISKFSITANNQEVGSWFHSFTAILTQITHTYIYKTLFLLYFLPSVISSGNLDSIMTFIAT